MTVEHGITFADRSGRELQLDLYRPPVVAPSTRTAVVQLHGGGFRVGSPEMMEPRARALSALGFVCVAPEYRFVTDAPWPAQLHDVRSAVRWVREHAGELGVDPLRVVVQGNSAGGHLALMAAGTGGDDRWDPPDADTVVSAEVAAVVATYAPVELFDVSERFPAGVDVDLADLAGLARPDGASPAAVLLGGGGTAADAAAASPITHLSARFPPTLVIHGTADTTVSPESSRRLHRALLEHGVTTELVEYADQVHEFDAGPVFAEVVAQHIAGFLRRIVVDPELFGVEQAEHNPFATG